MKLRVVLLIILGSIIAYYCYKRREPFEQMEVLDSETPNNWITEFIDKVFVIALPNRKNSILNTLKSVGIIPEVYDAYLKKNVTKDKPELIKSGFLDKDYTVSESRIACHYSHIQVLKKFLEDRNAETCLIFEDDLEIPISEKELKIVFKSIKDTSDKIVWDVINLGRCWDHCEDINYSIGMLVKSPHSQCRHAYIVSRKGAQIMVDQAVPMKHKPGDNMIAKLNTEGKLEYFGTKEQIFKQARALYGSSLNNPLRSPPTCHTG